MGVTIKDIKKNNKNDNEIIRIDVSEFQGKEYISIRIWYSTVVNGEFVYKPTQKGVSLPISEFSELQDAVNRLENYINDKNTGSMPEQFSEPSCEEEVKEGNK